MKRQPKETITYEIIDRSDRTHRKNGRQRIDTETEEINYDVRPRRRTDERSELEHRKAVVREIEREQQKKSRKPEKRVAATAYETNQSGRSYKENRVLYERSKARHSHESERNDSVTVKKRKKSKNKRVVAAVVFLALIIVLGVVLLNPKYRNSAAKGILKSPFGTIFANLFIGKNYETYVRDKNFDESKIIIHDGVETPKGYLSVALFGVDARTEDLTIGTLADSMMVVSVDNEGNVKMGSIYRDTYLLCRNANGEPYISKANSAYFINGPIGAINMLNENWDLAIRDYVVVNFSGLANIVNQLGGVVIHVDPSELNQINGLQAEQVQYSGHEFVSLDEAGDQLLTGDQFTAFCRIRAINFTSPIDGQVYTDDYGRTARQRYALTELLKQAKQKGLLKLLGMSNALFASNNGTDKFIQTSLTMKELVKFLGQAFDLNIQETKAFPLEDYAYGCYLDSGASIVADTLEENTVFLHEFLYNRIGYNPSDGLKNVAQQIRDEVARQW